jgi:hypothetical protein
MKSRAHPPSRALPWLLLSVLTATTLACDRDSSHSGSGVATVSLSVSGVTVIGSGVTLRLDEIVSDSRCPATAICVWAGEATAGLTVTGPGGTTPFRLGTLAPSATAAGYRFELLEISPYPYGTDPIPTAQYRVRIRIRRA